MAESHDYLVDFLKEKGYPEVRKTRHEYLSYYGLDQSSVCILVSGVVKASVTLREGNEFNIVYIQGPSPVSLLRDEVSCQAKSPFSVRVESSEAVCMMVPRVTFWRYVNEGPKLLTYVKDYYRNSLEDSLHRMRYLTMNGKIGAVGGLLFDLNSRYGVACEDGSMISLDVTNEDIAQFCGISSRNSVNRILRGFREKGVISTQGHDAHIVIHDPEVPRALCDGLAPARMLRSHAGALPEQRKSAGRPRGRAAGAFVRGADGPISCFGRASAGRRPGRPRWRRRARRRGRSPCGSWGCLRAGR